MLVTTHWQDNSVGNLSSCVFRQKGDTPGTTWSVGRDVGKGPGPFARLLLPRLPVPVGDTAAADSASGIHSHPNIATVSKQSHRPGLVVDDIPVILSVLISRPNGSLSLSITHEYLRLMRKTGCLSCLCMPSSSIGVSRAQRVSRDQSVVTT